MQRPMRWICGVPRFPGLDTECCERIRDAALRGNAAAAFIIGKACYFGEGLPKDRDTGLEMLVFAAEHGHQPAKQLLASFGPGSGLRTSA